MSSAVPLTQAVTSGDASAVRAAIAKGADVNERNNGGQTALILAVIFGHTELVRLLVKAGANPRLRDNLGLDAVEWAQRRGLSLDLFEIRVEPSPAPETPIATDERSRRWLAGVKQRIQEEAATQREPPLIQPLPEIHPEPVIPAKQVVVEAEPVLRAEPPVTKPEPVAALQTEPPVAKPEPVAAATTSRTRKRCPKCNAIYNSELVAYCAHHVVRLVDVEEPMFEPPLSTGAAITNSPLLWMLVLATVSIAAFTGYLITSQLSRVVIPDSAAAPQQPLGFLKGTPVAAGDLAGKALTLVSAESPIFENSPRSTANANTASQTVTVHIKLDKNGKVFWARADGGNEAMRNAATEAATRSTFSPDKLRGRETEGTITYTFAP